MTNRQELSRWVVAKLRELLPDTEEAGADDGYCVAGALAAVMHLYDSKIRKQGYPNCTYVAKLLRQLNPALKAATARKFAYGITDHNDSGQFEQAWQQLEKALAWQPRPQVIHAWPVARPSKPQRQRRSGGLPMRSSWRAYYGVS